MIVKTSMSTIAHKFRRQELCNICLTRLTKVTVLSKGTNATIDRSSHIWQKAALVIAYSPLISSHTRRMCIGDCCRKSCTNQPDRHRHRQAAFHNTLFSGLERIIPLPVVGIRNYAEFTQDLLPKGEVRSIMRSPFGQPLRLPSSSPKALPYCSR